MDAEVYLQEKQAAKLLAQKPQTLTKWRSRRRGPAYCKLGGKIRYRLCDLNAFIEAGRIDPKQKRQASRRRRRLKRFSVAK
jgi:hypothetical protein